MSGGDLLALSTEANLEADRADECAREAVNHAVRAGALLLQAKTQIVHGGWCNWLAANWQRSERTAQAYMRLATELPRLDPEKAQRVADLSLRDALKAISAPKPEEPTDLTLLQKLHDVTDELARLADPALPSDLSERVANSAHLTTVQKLGILADGATIGGKGPVPCFVRQLFVLQGTLIDRGDYYCGLLLADIADVLEGLPPDEAPDRTFFARVQRRMNRAPPVDPTPRLADLLEAFDQDCEAFAA